MESNQQFTGIQRVMVGHALLIMLSTLLVGLTLWASLLGGFEIYPGFVFNFQLPGTAEGWARAHRGIPMNSLMVLGFALIINRLGLKESKKSQYGWVIIFTGWANTVFYIASNFSSNRGLSFGANKFGEGDFYSFLALAPAYLFGVLSMGVICILAIKALQKS